MSHITRPSRLVAMLLGIGSLAAIAARPALADDWKGENDPSILTLAPLAGLGVIDNHTTFTTLGALGAKIVTHGFVPDITDDAWIEAEAGPAFGNGGTALVFSLALRWDFIMDPHWTFFALGGLGGDTTSKALGDHFELFPRFGVGVLYNIFQNLSIRAEISHEYTVAGVQFAY